MVAWLFLRQCTPRFSAWAPRPSRRCGPTVHPAPSNRLPAPPSRSASMNLSSRPLMVIHFTPPVLRRPRAWASPASRWFRGPDGRTWFQPLMALACLLTLVVPGMAQPPPPPEKATPAPPAQTPPEAQPTPSPETRPEDERPPLRDLGQV